MGKELSIDKSEDQRRKKCLKNMSK